MTTMRTIIRVIEPPDPAKKPGKVELNCGHEESVFLPLGADTADLVGNDLRCRPCTETFKNYGDSFVDGLQEARRMYAQAWVNATGETIEEVDFTIGFLEQRIRRLLDKHTKINDEVVAALACMPAWEDLEEAGLDPSSEATAALAGVAEALTSLKLLIAKKEGHDD